MRKKFKKSGGKYEPKQRRSEKLNKEKTRALNSLDNKMTSSSNKCPPEMCSVEERIKKVHLDEKSEKGAVTTNGVSQSPTTSLKREDYLTWDEYFMASAFLSSMRSKDPATQVGAVIVNPQNRIVGVGYNGMPTGCSDDTLPWGKTSSGLNTTNAMFLRVFFTFFNLPHLILSLHVFLSGTCWWVIPLIISSCFL